MMTMNSRKTLEKKQLKSLFWRSFTTSHAWHYERQQHMSFEFAMIPVINKLYDKEEDRIDAYKRHMEFSPIITEAPFRPFSLSAPRTICRVAPHSFLHSEKVRA